MDAMPLTRCCSATHQGPVTEDEGDLVALAQDFAVYEMSRRRDLESLQAAGVVRRARRGVMLALWTDLEPLFELRSREATLDKAPIARTIADHLRLEESVILDSSSTLIDGARNIRGRGLGLTIVRPSLLVAVDLATEPDTRVMLTRLAPPASVRGARSPAWRHGSGLLCGPKRPGRCLCRPLGRTTETIRLSIQAGITSRRRRAPGGVQLVGAEAEGSLERQEATPCRRGPGTGTVGTIERLVRASQLHNNA